MKTNECDKIFDFILHNNNIPIKEGLLKKRFVDFIMLLYLSLIETHEEQVFFEKLYIKDIPEELKNKLIEKGLTTDIKELKKAE